MKIPASIRRLYEDQRAPNERLKLKVDDRIRSICYPSWHYVSRIKEELSFALKLETGRVKEPRALEDFFACTLVVPNATEIAEAERLINENFVVKQRRPPFANKTHKKSHEFPFDELRLFAKLQTTAALPAADVDSIIFEIQIKTFLQHAWSIATHDLIYKNDDPNWSKERIAYQIKAMLEHAEISIQEAERLATTEALLKEDTSTTQLRMGITLLKSQWTTDELPSDVRRLAQNITSLLQNLKIEIARLEEILIAEKAARFGAHPSNLSPYATVLQYLFLAEKNKMVELLTRAKPKTKVLIPREIELPVDINPTTLINAIFVGNPF